MRHIRHQWPNAKIVIFGSYLRLLDIVARVFKHEFGMDCLLFDGTMSKDQKQTAQVLFDPASGSKVMLITSGSGGVGLNIQSASIVVQMEIWWNENCERQAGRSKSSASLHGTIASANPSARHKSGRPRQTTQSCHLPFERWTQI